MRRFAKFLLFSVAVPALMSSSAFAADPALTEIETQPQDSFTGYFDLIAANRSGHEVYGGTTWDSPQFGGAAHMAWYFNPSFSAQLDGWVEGWDGRYTKTCTIASPCKKAASVSYDHETWMGLGAHLTHHMSEQTSVGVLLSYGETKERNEWYGNGGNFVNVGLETTYNVDQFRFYGQVGYTHAVGDGYSSRANASDYYGQVVVAYYPTEDLSVSFNFGADRFAEDWSGKFSDYKWKNINWGTRVEYQHPGKQVSFYIAYQSNRANSNWYDGDFYNHIVGAGITFSLQNTSLRDRDRKAGLADYNMMFGKTFKR